MHAQRMLTHPRVAAAVWWVRKVKSCDAMASTASAQVSYIGHLSAMDTDRLVRAMVPTSKAEGHSTNIATVQGKQTDTLQP